jgi:hypothetical protein
MVSLLRRFGISVVAGALLVGLSLSAVDCSSGGGSSGGQAGADAGANAGSDAGGSDSNAGGSTSIAGTSSSAGSLNSSGAAGEAGETGVSGGCRVALDCPNPGRECLEPACVDGTCDIGFTKAGVPTVMQVPGDCKKTICDGSGAFSIDIDDTDLPDDGNPCTIDECTNGVPTHTPTGTSTMCGATLKFKCDGKGGCAGCASAADCGTNTACTTYTCTAGVCKTNFVANGQGDPGGQHAGDCQKNVCNGAGDTVSINDNTDVPVDNKPCTQDLCTNGAPSNPNLPVNTSCGGIAKCDATGTCVCNDPDACTGKCGTLTDRCGHTQNCPTNVCTGYDTCGGGGSPNVCGCSPDRDPCGDQCAGTASDGCGGVVACHADCSMNGLCPCSGGKCYLNYCSCNSGPCN